MEKKTDTKLSFIKYSNYCYITLLNLARNRGKCLQLLLPNHRIESGSFQEVVIGTILDGFGRELVGSVHR